MDQSIIIPLIFTSLTLFVITAISEIGGGYMIWLWRNQKKSILFGLSGGMILFAYGILQTFQLEEFGRVYAAYGGIFVISSIVWGWIVEKKKPDRYEILGSCLAVFGAMVIFYAPR